MRVPEIVSALLWGFVVLAIMACVVIAITAGAN